VYFYDVQIESKPLGIPYMREADPQLHSFVDLRAHLLSHESPRCWERESTRRAIAVAEEGHDSHA